MNIQEFIKKLQGLPEKQRKIILWTIVVLVGLLLTFIWFKITIKRFEKIKGEEVIKGFNLPSFEITDTSKIEEKEE